MTIRLGDIVAALGGELRGDPDAQVTSLAPAYRAKAGEMTFLTPKKTAADLAQIQASVVVLPPALAQLGAPKGVSCVITAQPYLYYARLSQWWAARVRPPLASGVHPTAYVAPGVKLPASVHVGPFAVIEHAAQVGAHGVLGAHCVVGEGVVLGEHARLAAHVTLGQGCVVGARAVMHAGVVLGADGFGFAPDGPRWEKIAQLGVVRVGDDVELGANTCVDRGALDDTVLGHGVKLDNLVQIGHNVQVGDHTAMAGCVGVAGSAVIGARCTLGGGAIVLGHLRLADDVHVSAASVVTRSIEQAGRYSGVFPLDAHDSWEKNAATLRQLHRLRERLRRLETPHKD
jgi:UDP-3-O-[3-hydroxymyristoyl] glucosamine N-acyltransferase